eukprot:365069-Chlamydomonas_euryale.AAC.32
MSGTPGMRVWHAVWAPRRAAPCHGVWASGHAVWASFCAAPRHATRISGHQVWMSSDAAIYHRMRASGHATRDLSLVGFKRAASAGGCAAGAPHASLQRADMPVSAWKPPSASQPTPARQLPHVWQLWGPGRSFASAQASPERTRPLPPADLRHARADKAVGGSRGAGAGAGSSSGGDGSGDAGYACRPLQRDLMSEFDGGELRSRMRGGGRGGDAGNSSRRVPEPGLERGRAWQGRGGGGGTRQSSPRMRESELDGGGAWRGRGRGGDGGTHHSPLRVRESELDSGSASRRRASGGRGDAHHSSPRVPESALDGALLTYKMMRCGSVKELKALADARSPALNGVHIAVLAAKARWMGVWGEGRLVGHGSMQPSIEQRPHCSAGGKGKMDGCVGGGRLVGRGSMHPSIQWRPHCSAGGKGKKMDVVNGCRGLSFCG